MKNPSTVGHDCSSSEPNADQLKAIRTTEGPLLIIAGPGSGKTFTLVERVIYLITNKGVPPENLLVVTFTEKAAQELTTRISNRLEETGLRFNLNEMYLGTFHSICLRWLEEYREFTRLKRNFVMMDEFDQKFFVYDHISDFEAIPEISLIIGGHKSSSWKKTEFEAGAVVKTNAGPVEFGEQVPSLHLDEDDQLFENQPELDQPLPRFLKNERVRLRQNPAKVGLIASDPIFGEGEFNYEVFFAGDEQRTIAERDLQPIPREVRMGYDREFLRDLLVLKLQKPLEDNLYSAYASKTKFEVYQFKPALKFLRNADQRLLMRFLKN